mgnify:CR=1 FL=1
MVIRLLEILLRDPSREYYLKKLRGKPTCTSQVSLIAEI